MESLAAIVKTVRVARAKSRGTHQEMITIIQVRDDGGLGKEGGCRKEDMRLGPRCILKQVLTRSFDGLYVGVERKKNRERFQAFWSEKL